MLLNKLSRIDKYTKIQLILSLFFGIFYANISIVNHINFRTNWFDLGFYTHHIFEYSSLNFSHLKTNLSDHFDLFLVFISPLRYLFGQYTLLIVQIASILIGSFGIFQYSHLILKNKQKALILQLTFLLSFAVISSIGFDYHSNVIAACLVPHLLYFFKTSNRPRFIITWLLIIFTKENVMFNTSVLLLFLPFFHKESPMKKLCFGLGIFSLILFWLLVSKIMPSFSNTAVYFNFRYTNVGNSKNFTEMFVYIISHPLEIIQRMFSNTRNDLRFDYYKIEAHVFIFLCGGFLLFRKPILLLICAPLYLQKFLHDSQNVWGLSYQYNIEFIPIIFMGIVSIIENDFKSVFLNKYGVYVFLIFNIILTIRMMDNTISFVKKSSIRIYQEMHYESDINKNVFNELANRIPDKASVCAQSFFTPHLSLRDSIFQFDGTCNNAQYILLADSSQPYPLSAKAFQDSLNKIMTNDKYLPLANKQGIILLKRK